MREMTMPDRVIQLADGRTLAIDERGSYDAPAVVLLHPAPGSRRFDPDPAATAAAGIRLLTIDRHGYGGSTPLPDGAVPTVVGHADDVAMALDQLGVAQAGIIGWSAGGRVRTTLVYGGADAIAGPLHGEWYAARIPRAKLQVVPGSGHLVALNAWASIIAAVA
jgi:pimeloyl-ACP methyl ester carboxylesterase